MSLAANTNQSGRGMNGASVKGLPSGGAKGRPAKSSGDNYGKNIQAACADGFKEGKMAGADDASGAIYTGKETVVNI